MVEQAGLSPERPYARSPRASGGANTVAGLFVDDADAHRERVRPGVAIATEPATRDYGEGYWADRGYEAEDPEGHHWWFHAGYWRGSAQQGAGTAGAQEHDAAPLLGHRLKDRITDGAGVDRMGCNPVTANCGASAPLSKLWLYQENSPVVRGR